MYALAPRRCPYCVGVLTSMPLDRAEEIGVRGPVLVCGKCDSPPGTDDTLHLPDDWG